MDTETKTGRSRPIVALDGPSGVGKSTVARLVAERLGYTLVDTGAIYRSVAWLARQKGTSWDDGGDLSSLIVASDIRLSRGTDGSSVVLIDGKACGQEIRTPEISMGASSVSRHGKVRSVLLDLQREFGRQGGVVLEGRDIGTVVFPDAEVKAFLTASPEVRAKRRYDELVGKGVEVTYKETLSEVILRDEQDANREVAPLKPATDATIIDTSEMSIGQVVSRVIELLNKK